MKNGYIFSLEPDLHNRLKAYCKNDGKKMSNLVERLIENYLKVGN